MHKRILNELRIDFIIEPQGPLLIKSGRESGADPTLLDMNFVRLNHVGLGETTVYLPGSSLKGTLRSYCEKIARTVANGYLPKDRPPLSCNPLGSDARRGRPEYACGQYFEEHKSADSAEKHAGSCAICRIFGHTALAGHLRLADAYPWDPDDPEDRTWFQAANRTEQRDGVAIDRISGAVAAGPFQLEVVTAGRFYSSLTVKNFQLWQVGLLAIALRDIARERVPLGFSKSRGLGRVTLHYRRLEVAYPGRFDLSGNGRDLSTAVFAVAGFLDKETANQYGYRPETPLPLPSGAKVVEKGDYGRVVLVWSGETVEGFLRACVPYWRDFVAEWRGG